MNVSKIQYCKPHKQSFGINPTEGEKTVGQAAAELGSAIKREASKTLEEVKKDAQPLVKKIKKAAKFVSEKLAKFAEEGEEAPKELPKQ